MILRRLLLSTMVAVLLGDVWPRAGCGAGADAAPADAPAAGVLRFRRVYGPADRLKDWLRGNVKYVPIEPAEFERLLSLVRTATPGAQPSSGAQLASAEYQACLVGNELTGAEATVKVVHSAKGPVLLPLDPCGLAIGKATWLGSEPAKEATLGLGADGKLAALVERSGQLHFTWSLAGRRDPSDVLHFQIELPACPVNRFSVDVPESMSLVSEYGLVQEMGWVDEGVRRWRIELGGRHHFHLRAVPPGAVQQRTQLALVKESLIYNLSLRGVDVSADLKFEVHNEPLSQVTVALDPGLHLVSAKYGDAAVPWSVVSPGDGQETTVVLTLPEPIQDSGRVLRLGAIAPLLLDRPWRLPRIRPQQVFWQEGDATLSVPVPLVLKQLSPLGSRQSKIEPLAAPRVGESAQFQYYDVDATVEVLLAQRSAVAHVLSGTAVVLGRRETSARVVADFHGAEAPQYLLEADLSSQWQIDTIESLPAGALEDWTIDKEKNKRKLLVRLAKALAPEQPVRIVAVAHRPASAPGQKLGIDGLVPLRFRVSGASKRLVTVRTVDPYQPQVTGDDRLRRPDYRSLEAGELELFAEPPRGLLFEDDAGAVAVQVTLENRKPRYAGEIQCEATVDERTVQEDYLFDCVPESAGVTRLLVRFSQRRDAPLRWTLVGPSNRQLSARSLSKEEQAAAGLDADQETWEVTLPRPQSEPFRIRGTRDLALAGPLAVSLASLPEAVSQRATLVVRCLGRSTVQITNRGLQPIPTASVPAAQCQTARATYSYNPVRDTAAASGAAVTIETSANSTTPAASVWHCHLESWYEAHGAGRHQATYRLQNFGGGQVQLTLPPMVAAGDVRGIWVDDRRIAWHPGEDDRQNILQIDLPAEQRFPTVAVDFSTPARGLGIIGSREPPLPQTDLPILSRHWTVWLPPGYRSLDADPRWQSLGLPQLTWSQRLFGPLGRAPTAPTFDPLAPFTADSPRTSGRHVLARLWDFAAPWFCDFYDEARHSARIAAQHKAEALLELLGTPPGKDAAAQEAAAPNWADLLAPKRIERLQVRLLVDRHALRQLLLTPQTELRPPSGDTPLARGLDLLQKAGLALLVRGDTVLLTSLSDAALLHAWLAPLKYPGVSWVLPGPLAEQLQQSAAGPDGTFVPAETWRRELAEPLALWPRAGLAAREATDTPGWTAYRTELSDTLPVRLSFVHYQTVQLLGSVVFLLVAAAGWWKLRGRPLWLASLAGVAAVAALLLPEACVPLASGALLGAVFCLIAGSVCRWGASRAAVAENHETQVPSTISLTTRLGILLLAGAALVCPGHSARGQQPPGTSPQPAPVYQVLIPIDSRQQPTGDKYLLPEEFYTQLHRLAAAATSRPRDWLLGAAVYRGALTREATSGQLTIEELKATFDLHVLSQMARVRIPLQREGANLLPDGILLDGRAVEAEWDANGDALLFDVLEPGEYRLELALRPTMRSEGGAAGFDLAIPHLANSRLELLLPANAPNIDVPSAIGSVWREDDPRQLVAELGPAERLTVRWPVGARSSASGPAVDVEELLWLNVKPGPMILDARFKLKVTEGQVRQLQISADPDLRLLTLTGTDSPKHDVRAVPGQPQTIVLQWPRPISDRTVVEAQFRLTGTSWVGNLRPPQLEVLDARTTRRWLAVSVDPTLEHEEHAAAPVEAVAAADFAAAWGKADVPPQFALRLASGETAWSMSTRPRQPHTTVEQNLALSFAEDDTAVFFDAQLVTTAGYNFQLRLSAPRQLAIERVSLVKDGVERVTHWSQDDDGRITVFLSGPVKGRQTLALHGHLPPRPSALPGIQIEQGQLLSSNIQVFRQPSVRVKIGPHPALVEIKNPPPEPASAGLGHLYQAFRVEPGQSPDVPLSVTPNRPKVRAEQVTWLHHDGQAWQAEVAYRMRVSGGLVDELCIEVPTSFVVLPTANLKVVDAPGERRQLVFQPPAPIEGEFQFSISGSLALSPGERVQAPAITLKKVGELKQFLALPGEIEGQPIAWETLGLKAGRLPDGFVAPPGFRSPVIYEVADEPYQAILRTPDENRGAARVRLADIRITWHADQSLRGLATFDLEPGNLSECSLQMPAGCRLVELSVADVPAAPWPQRDNAWRVPLGPARLPQRIEVVFTGTLADAGSHTGRRFDAPTLGDLPVSETLWTVVGPASFAAGEPEAGEPLSPWQSEMARLRNTAAMIQALAAAGDDDPQKTLSWYRLWARRLLAARAVAGRSLLQSRRTQAAQAAWGEVRAIYDEQLRLAARIGAMQVLTEVSDERPQASQADELWSWSADRPPPAVQLAFSEGVGSITLDYRPVRRGDLAARLVMAFGLALLIPLGILALRRRAPRWWLKKWPHVVGASVGLAWWLWLWPSVLGLVAGLSIWRQFQVSR